MVPRDRAEVFAGGFGHVTSHYHAGPDRSQPARDRPRNGAFAEGATVATTLADDLAQACATLDEKGGLHAVDRKRVKTGTGY
jgi:hypothetical protein